MAISNIYRSAGRHIGKTVLVLTVRRLWPFLTPERGSLALNAGVTLAVTGVEIALPLVVGRLVDGLLAELGGAPPAAPGRPLLVGVLLVLALARGVLVSYQRALSGLTGERTAARLRDAVWRHLGRLPLDYARRRGGGRLLMRFIGDARAVQRMVTNGVVQLGQDGLLIAGVLLALTFVSRRLALVAATVLPAYAIMFRVLNPRLRRASRATRRRRSRLSAYIHERVAGMAIVKAANQQEREAAQVARLNRELADRAARRAAVGAWLQGSAGGIVAANTALVLLVAAPEALAGRITAGALVAFYALLSRLAPVLQRIATANRYIQEAAISIERLTALLAEPVEGGNDDAQPALVVEGAMVAFEAVSYRLPDGRQALDGVSMCARRGEIVALAGHNGAGKTLLLELLVRFREPSAGRIRIDGQDIAGCALASLRAAIGYVPQDAPLFDGSIGDNIGYGLDIAADRERVQRAAQIAGVSQFVAGLRDGLATRVGGGGRLLSGGQRQQVALARALAPDPPILVLDEATSALDAESEAAIARALRSLARDKTILIAAHRLPTLRAVDRIYVLEAGQLVEAGAHDELMVRSGAYARLVGGAGRSAAEETKEEAIDAPLLHAADGRNGADRSAAAG